MFDALRERSRGAFSHGSDTAILLQRRADAEWTDDGMAHNVVMYASRAPLVFRRPSAEDALGNGMRLETLSRYFGGPDTEPPLRRSATRRSNTEMELQSCLAIETCSEAGGPPVRAEHRPGQRDHAARLPRSALRPVPAWGMRHQWVDAVHHWRIMRTAFGPAFWNIH